MDRIIVRNNTDLLVIIGRYTRLGKVIEYKVTKYFQVNTLYTNLVIRPPKTLASKFLIKSYFKAGLIIVITFNIIITPRIFNLIISNITYPSLITSNLTFTLLNLFTL